jgi:hypothetical protein
MMHKLDAPLPAQERRAGPTAALPEEWVEVVHRVKVPDEFCHLDADFNEAEAVSRKQE